MQKNPLRKHQIFEKWDDFENRPSCKGYSLYKMVNLGQKLKFKQTCEDRFFNHIRVVLCKKPLEKTPNIREMRRFWKWAIMHWLYPFQNGQFGSKINIKKKHGKNVSLIILELFFNHIRVALCKKTLEKRPNIPGMRRFWKSAIMQRL